MFGSLDSHYASITTERYNPGSKTTGIPDSYTSADHILGIDKFSTRCLRFRQPRSPGRRGSSTRESTCFLGLLALLGGISRFVHRSNVSPCPYS